MAVGIFSNNDTQKGVRVGGFVVVVLQPHSTKTHTHDGRHSVTTARLFMITCKKIHSNTNANETGQATKTSTTVQTSARPRHSAPRVMVVGLVPQAALF